MRVNDHLTIILWYTLWAKNFNYFVFMNIKPIANKPQVPHITKKRQSFIAFEDLQILNLQGSIIKDTTVKSPVSELFHIQCNVMCLGSKGFVGFRIRNIGGMHCHKQYDYLIQNKKNNIRLRLHGLTALEHSIGYISAKYSLFL